MPSPLTYILVGLAVVTVPVLLWLAFPAVERSFVYFPVGPMEGDPYDVGLAYEDVLFQTGDGVNLHGWFVPGTGKITLLWFHGNAGNISNRIWVLKLLHGATKANIFLFDYRGYGRSGGRPSEEGLYLDGEAAVDYLAKRGDVNVECLVYFGQSLGAAVAVEMAVRHPPRGLILEAAFPSIPYMARWHYPFIPRRLLHTRYDSLVKLPKLGVPLLLVHGDSDDIAPLEGAKMLFTAAGAPKELYLIRSAGHNDTFEVGGSAYLETIRRYLAGVEEPPCS